VAKTGARELIVAAGTVFSQCLTQLITAVNPRLRLHGATFGAPANIRGVFLSHKGQLLTGKSFMGAVTKRTFGLAGLGLNFTGRKARALSFSQSPSLELTSSEC
jgi:hypothetical protein